MFGKTELTHCPHSPCCLKWNGGFITLPGTEVTVTHLCTDAGPLRQGWSDVLARLAKLSFDGE